MPLYDYECKVCGSAAEVHHKLAESGPTCCSYPMEKIIGAVVGSIAPMTGPIVDMRQVKDSHGARWRETSKTGRPGGDRKRDYYFGS